MQIKVCVIKNFKRNSTLYSHIRLTYHRYNFNLQTVKFGVGDVHGMPLCSNKLNETPCLKIRILLKGVTDFAP